MTPRDKGRLVKKYVPALSIAGGLVLAFMSDPADLAIAVGIVAAFAGIIWLAGRWVPDRPPVRADAVREHITRTDAWGVTNPCGCRFRRDGTWEQCPADALLTEWQLRADAAFSRSENKGAP